MSVSGAASGFYGLALCTRDGQVVWAEDPGPHAQLLWEPACKAIALGLAQPSPVLGVLHLGHHCVAYRAEAAYVICLLCSYTCPRPAMVLRLMELHALTELLFFGQLGATAAAATLSRLQPSREPLLQLLLAAGAAQRPDGAGAGGAGEGAPLPAQRDLEAFLSARLRAPVPVHRAFELLAALPSPLALVSSHLVDMQEQPRLLPSNVLFSDLPPPPTAADTPPRFGSVDRGSGRAGSTSALARQAAAAIAAAAAAVPGLSAARDMLRPLDGQLWELLLSELLGLFRWRQQQGQQLGGAGRLQRHDAASAAEHASRAYLTIDLKALLPGLGVSAVLMGADADAAPHEHPSGGSSSSRTEAGLILVVVYVCDEDGDHTLSSVMTNSEAAAFKGLPYSIVRGARQLAVPPGVAGALDAAAAHLERSFPASRRQLLEQVPRTATPATVSPPSDEPLDDGDMAAAEEQAGGGEAGPATGPAHADLASPKASASATAVAASLGGSAPDPPATAPAASARGIPGLPLPLPPTLPGGSRLVGSLAPAAPDWLLESPTAAQAAAQPPVGQQGSRPHLPRPEEGNVGVNGALGSGGLEPEVPGLGAAPAMPCLPGAGATAASMAPRRAPTASSAFPVPPAAPRPASGAGGTLAGPSPRASAGGMLPYRRSMDPGALASQASSTGSSSSDVQAVGRGGSAAADERSEALALQPPSPEPSSGTRVLMGAAARATADASWAAAQQQQGQGQGIGRAGGRRAGGAAAVSQPGQPEGQEGRTAANPLPLQQLPRINPRPQAYRGSAPGGSTQDDTAPQASRPSRSTTDEGSAYTARLLAGSGPIGPAALPFRAVSDHSAATATASGPSSPVIVRSRMSLPGMAADMSLRQQTQASAAPAAAAMAAPGAAAPAQQRDWAHHAMQRYGSPQALRMAAAAGAGAASQWSATATAVAQPLGAALTLEQLRAQRTRCVRCRCWLCGCLLCCWVRLVWLGGRTACVPT